MTGTKEVIMALDHDSRLSGGPAGSAPEGPRPQSVPPSLAQMPTAVASRSLNPTSAADLIAQVQNGLVAAGIGRDDAEAQRKAFERRATEQPTERMIGRVTFCNGARATVSTMADNLSETSSDFWSVGRLISITVGKVRVVALVYEMSTDSSIWKSNEANAVSVQVELMGEISEDANGHTRFHRGVSRYPQVGAVAHKIRARDLEVMHDLGDRKSVEVGRLSQNADIPATVSVNDLLTRHFAVVGTTGVGKSCSLTLLVRQCLSVKPNLRVVILDPHNEFAGAFGSLAQVFDSTTLELPFWLFRFEELEDVIFRGKTIPEEAEILREVLAQAKTNFQNEKNGATAAGLVRKALDVGGLNADSPMPYRMSELFKLIDENIGLLSPRHERHHLKSLRVRLDALVNDPRYGFMFTRGGAEDNFAPLLARLFRLPADGKPVSIMNLAGLPSDVTNAVVSVLARLCFDVAYASEGQLHVLLVCEEAHRYVPQDPNAGFIPTRRAIARIAKEGRKYGCSIAVVSQRPGELDPTILSQCSTVFAMRLANDRDQEIIRSAIADSSGSTISFLSALDNAEAIVFGEAVATTMRFKFTYQEPAKLPRAAGTDITDPVANARQTGEADPRLIATRLRGMRELEKPPQPTMLAEASSQQKLAAAAGIAATSGLRPHTSTAGTPLPRPTNGLRT
jgi:DNA helicase HerA-like ATPase